MRQSISPSIFISIGIYLKCLDNQIPNFLKYNVESRGETWRDGLSADRPTRHVSPLDCTLYFQKFGIWWSKNLCYVGKKCATASVVNNNQLKQTINLY